MPLPDYPELTGLAWQEAAAGLLIALLAEYAETGLLVPQPDEPATGTETAADGEGPAGTAQTGPGSAPEAEPGAKSDNEPDNESGAEADGGPESGARPDFGPGPALDAEAGPARYRLHLASHAVYSFRARRGAWGTWRIQPGSVLRVADGGAAAADDPARFVVDARAELGLDEGGAARLVRDVNAAVVAAVRDTARERPSAAEAAELPYLDLAAWLRTLPRPDGADPAFAATDAARWAPAARNPVRLPWAAVHRGIGLWRGGAEADEQRLLGEELEPSTRRRFTAKLRDRGLDPADYRWLPVHPWHWDATVLPLFAADVAHGRIVPLGDGGPDRYLPHDGGRVFTNLDRPGRRDVVLPLAEPGAEPAARTAAPPHPAAAAWFAERLRADAFLAEARTVVLADLASAAVRHPDLDPHADLGLFAAAWREPLAARLEPGERARPLAALTHRDPAGTPLVAELVRRSGLAPREWLRWLCTAAMPPMIHLLYRYGLAFPVTGTSLVLVSDAAEVPARLVLRGAGSAPLLCHGAGGLPFPEAAGLPLPGSRPADGARLLAAALFDGPMRRIAAVAVDELGLSEKDFRELADDEIDGYRSRFPDLAERHALFGPIDPSRVAESPLDARHFGYLLWDGVPQPRGHTRGAACRTPPK